MEDQNRPQPKITVEIVSDANPYVNTVRVDLGGEPLSHEAAVRISDILHISAGDAYNLMRGGHVWQGEKLFRLAKNPEQEPAREPEYEPDCEYEEPEEDCDMDEEMLDDILDEIFEAELKTEAFSEFAKRLKEALKAAPRDNEYLHGFHNGMEFVTALVQGRDMELMRRG